MVEHPYTITLETMAGKGQLLRIRPKVPPSPTVHTSRNWAETAEALAFALMHVQDYKEELARLREQHTRLLAEHAQLHKDTDPYMAVVDRATMKTTSDAVVVALVGWIAEETKGGKTGVDSILRGQVRIRLAETLDAWLQGKVGP